MTVYVVSKAYGYEGEETIGVFAKEADADAFALAEGAKLYDEPLKMFRFKDVHYWAESKEAPTQYYVRSFEVR